MFCVWSHQFSARLSAAREKLTRSPILAAPVHQVQEYYRYGKADDCFSHWSKLWDCLKQRTKFAEEASPAHSNVFIYIWELIYLICLILRVGFLCKRLSQAQVLMLLSAIATALLACVSVHPKEVRCHKWTRWQSNIWRRLECMSTRYIMGAWKHSQRLKTTVFMNTSCPALFVKRIFWL